MTPFLNGFSDELVKVGVAGLGALKSMGKFTVKHPLLTLGAGATVAGTAMAARAGHKRGMSGDKGPRLLAAGVDPYTGQAMPSGTAYRNHNIFFGKKKSKGVSKGYREKAFER